MRALQLSLDSRKGPLKRRNFVAVKRRTFDFNCLMPREIQTHTSAPTKGPWLRTSRSGEREDVYLTTSRNVRKGFGVLPLRLLNEIIACDFNSGYTAVGKQLYRTHRGVTTGSPLSVYLAVLVCFMHSTICTTRGGTRSDSSKTSLEAEALSSMD